MSNAILHGGEGGSDAPAETAESTLDSEMSTEENDSKEMGTPTSSENGTDEADLYSHGIVLYSNAQEEAGDFTIIGGASADEDFTYDDSSKVLTVKTANTLTIKNTDPNIPTGDRIVVENGVSANLILDGVNISTGSGAPISMGTSSANVTITLADGSQNTLSSSSNAALEKNSANGSLTIT